MGNPEWGSRESESGEAAKEQNRREYAAGQNWQAGFVKKGEYQRMEQENVATAEYEGDVDVLMCDDVYAGSA